MGTRVDFYVGRGAEAEWLGSYPFDGYPSGVFEDSPAILRQSEVTQDEWRQWVATFLADQGDRSTLPEQGWPWPWEDSRTTDYAYAWDGGAVYGSCFGHSWFRVDPDAEDWGEIEDELGKVAVFPDMTQQQAVTFGPRSGVIVLGG